MTKIKLLTLLVFPLIVSLFGLQAHTILAQTSPTNDPSSPEIPGLDKPVGQLTEEDLKIFVELSFNEQISAAQAQSFFERLTKKQEEIVSDLIAEQAGIPLDDWNREKEAFQQEIGQAANQPLPSSIGELWRQPIENRWTSGYPQGYSFASRYYQDQWCETTYPTDEDIDWVFHFNMTYSNNPDGLRWTSDSTQVYIVFMSLYNGNLNSFAYNWAHVKVCLGTNGVDAAGGPSNVKSNVFLTPNN
jgi:hypothetical protein